METENKLVNALVKAAFKARFSKPGSQAEYRAIDSLVMTVDALADFRAVTAKAEGKEAVKKLPKLPKKRTGAQLRAMLYRSERP